MPLTPSFDRERARPTTKDDEILRLRLALSRARTLIVDAGNELGKLERYRSAERLHEQADKLRDVIGDVDAPVPTENAELRELLNEVRVYLAEGNAGAFVRSGDGILDAIDAAIGPPT